jgi:hypothetical protein
MPYSDVSARCVKNFPKTWAAIYTDPVIMTPELFKLKIKDDEAIGNIRMININKNLYLDHYVTSLMEGTITFSDGDDKKTVIQHHEAMRRVRNPKFIELRHQWIKPENGKTADHGFHAGVYCSLAARLVGKGARGALPLSTMVSGFKLKGDI